jgi:hypothetical protein
VARRQRSTEKRDKRQQNAEVQPKKAEGYGATAEADNRSDDDGRCISNQENRGISGFLPTSNQQKIR